MTGVAARGRAGDGGRPAGRVEPVARLRSAVERAWRHGPAGLGGTVLDLTLAPPSWLWRGVTAARNAYHDRWKRPAVDGVAVVSVGNLVAGGTGKTPMTRWVVHRLLELDRHPAVALRGYGRDEALLHRRWYPGVPVCVDADRVRAVQAARARGADVVVIDDGFQHRRLPRDLDLVLLAAEDRFPGHPLPRGPYREPEASLARADGVIVTRRTASAERARGLAAAVDARGFAPVLAGAHIRPGAWLDLAGQPADAPAGDVLVVCAVARPEGVEAAVREATAPGTAIEALAFGDHHEYTERDLSAIRKAAGDRTVVITEKDAVKIAALEPPSERIRVVASEIVWDWGEHGLASALAGAVRAGAS